MIITIEGRYEIDLSSTTVLDGPIFDANFVTDYGANSFYRRLWYGEITTAGTTVTIAGAGLDASYVGRKIYIKHTRLGAKTPYGTYFTINSVTNDTTCVLNTAPQYDVTNEAGYIFHDNTAAFMAAIAAANTKGRTWNIFVPNGTYVIPSYNSVDASGGGFMFIGNQGVDTYGLATFKITPEETLGTNTGFVNFSTVSKYGNYSCGFKNVNLVARDNYPYDTTTSEALFKFPSSGTPTVSPKIIVENSNMQAEFEAFYTNVTDYLVRKYSATTAEQQKHYRLLEWLWVRPQLYKTSVISDMVNDAEFTFLNCKLHVTQNYNVVNSLYCRPKDKIKFTVKNTDIRGQVGYGRNGNPANELVKPIVNIEADENGDFTKVVISPTSPALFNIQTLAQQYDRFSRKRSKSVSVFYKIAGTVQKELITSSIKPLNGIPKYLGLATHVHNAGSGIYYVRIDDFVCSEKIGSASGGWERVEGVTQFDSIGSDGGGVYTEVYPTGINSSLNTLEGFLKDHRGVVRYNFGDGGQQTLNQAVDVLGDDVRKLRVCLPYKTDYAYTVGQIVRVQHTTTETLTITASTKTITGYWGSDLGNNNFKHIKIVGGDLDGTIYPCTMRPYYDVLGKINVPDLNSEGTYTVQLFNEMIVDQVQPLTDFGNMVALRLTTSTDPVNMMWATYSGFFVRANSTIYNSDFTTNYGSTKFGFSVNVGKQPTYPNGAPFVVGEKLFSWYSGTGNGTTYGFEQTKYHRNYFYINKWDAFPAAVTNLQLEWCSFALNGVDTVGGATHWVYGADDQGETILYDYENVNVALDATLNEGMSLVFRRANARSGSTFKNCALPRQELGSPITVIDGGSMTDIGKGTIIQTRNNPILTGGITSATITSLDTTGYTLNGIFIPN